MRLIFVVVALATSVWVGCVIVWAIISHRHPRDIADEGDDDMKPSWSSTPSPSPRIPSSTTTTPQPTPNPIPLRQCHLARVQPAGVADDLGRACRDDQLVEETNCCPPWTSLYSCTDCDKGCCAEYHHCVSCCMGQPKKTFHLCSSTCRTSSRSVDVHGKYIDETHRFCWKTTKQSAKKAKASARPSMKWLKLS